MGLVLQSCDGRQDTAEPQAWRQTPEEGHQCTIHFSIHEVIFEACCPTLRTRTLEHARVLVPRVESATRDAPVFGAQPLRGRRDACPSGARSAQGHPLFRFQSKCHSVKELFSQTCLKAGGGNK